MTRRRSRLHLETLEDRTVPAVITVTSTADSGTGTLRQAIADANSASYSGSDTIQFALGTGAQTISLDSALPDITEDLVIQGTVKGKISLKESLFVEASASVEADIEVQNVEITGKVTGNIAATDKVELKADCRVVGDVRAPRILIADGASFKGNVDMDVKER